MSTRSDVVITIRKDETLIDYIKRVYRDDYPCYDGTLGEYIKTIESAPKLSKEDIIKHLMDNIVDYSMRKMEEDVNDIEENMWMKDIIFARDLLELIDKGEI